MNKLLDVNHRSFRLLDLALDSLDELKVKTHSQGTSTVFDFGIEADGGLEAGLLLAKCTCGDLARIQLAPQIIGDRTYTAIQVSTDHPLLACMGSQYAGWPVQSEDFFAMASGPIRSLRGKEKILEEFELTQSSSHGVICLESSRIPPEETIKNIAEESGIAPEQLRIAVAPTSSIAGSVQVVARSVETALHKLHEIGFDLTQVQSGHGIAPLPPIANDDLKGIGLTNDSILFGGQVELWVDAEQTQIDEVGPQLPSSDSSDYGTPFYDLFKQKEFKFYDIDPLLFSPACIRIHNLKSGQTRTFGQLNSQLLQQSFGF